MRRVAHRMPGQRDGPIRTSIFTLVVTCISRVLLAADRILGRVRSCAALEPSEVETSEVSLRRVSIPSHGNSLDAILVGPAAAPERASLLICHGIGEIVEHWTAAQRLLACRGVASLVFDYSGYGRSSGFVNADQCERDAIAAFQFLQALDPPRPVSVLGFSMGSGVAAAILDRVPAHRLVLCAAFTSFQDAATQVGWPRALAFLVPDIWRTKDALANLRAAARLPILLVHGAKDQLFPPRMALELKRGCGPQAEVVVVPELTHGAPFYHPDPAYWAAIADFLSQDSPAPHSE
jgi:pimeloyl-ACP methyl ester carboxylesterase